MSQVRNFREPPDRRAAGHHRGGSVPCRWHLIPDADPVDLSVPGVSVWAQGNPSGGRCEAGRVRGQDPSTCRLRPGAEASNGAA